MDYKKVKQADGAIKRREKMLKILAAVLAGTVLVQVITICKLFSYNNKYRDLYNESLETQLELHGTINRLKGTTQDSSQNAVSESTER